MNTKHLVATILTIITALCIFLLADILYVGLLAALSRKLGNAEAYYMFKWGVTVMFITETIMTIPAAVISCNKRR